MVTKKAIALTDERSQELGFVEAYGKAASQGGLIVGELLKFNKGDWFIGKDEKPFETDTKMLFSIDNVLVGWQFWEDKRVTDSDLGLLIKGHQKKARSELSFYNEKDAWPRDDDGEPSDPWQFANILLFRETGKNGEYRTFITASKGGLSSVGKFFVKVAEHLREAPDEIPIVKLDSDSYKHPKYSRVHFPTFEIVGWTAKEDFGTPVPNDDDEPEERAPAKKQLAPPKKSGTINIGGSKRSVTM